MIRTVPFRAAALAILLVTAPEAVYAGGYANTAPNSVEQLHYSWRLRGALGWLAGLRFPTRGTGELRTAQPNGRQPFIDTELKITSTDASGYYHYQSHIEADGSKTLMTFHGYKYAEKKRQERTFFDYVRRLARTHKETTEKVEDRVKPIPAHELRDVLTSIYFLRQEGDQLRGPLVSQIYSDGKLYPVVFKPVGRQSFSFKGQSIPADVYEIVAAPNAQKKWSGGVRVWISDDAQRIPVRIEILRNMASLQLDLVSM